MNGVREFRSHGDFYCYSVIEAAGNSLQKKKLSADFEATLASVGDKVVMSSVVFKFSDGSIFDLYKVNGSILGQQPLEEMK